ncbi:vesicular-fusion ATPase-like protein [Trypanosoma theileri]|uniref:Vesicle-fusing ATPase n=1 Tax=Trypanosoma theileri TaxID=67003 RepID=A0A1X0P437_9TRYP|nr:vesicular-fusion ATPase-like protein [Trypanosoma theileri]ORC91696.1 vesicular-fusion ATPase-like protein [Trypanosoma theileri]
MLYRFAHQRTACRSCVRTFLVMFLFLLHLTGGTAEEEIETIYLQEGQEQNSGTDESSSTRGVELLAISGCKRPSRPGRSRETYHCFAGRKNKGPVQLFIRGRGFPIDTPLRIRLQEHTPLPLREDEKSNADLITMECLDVKASEVFPHQILSCILPHPSVSLRGKSQWLKRLSHNIVWMDLELIVDTSISDSEVNDTSITIGILHHSVQLDLTLRSGNSIDGNLNNENILANEDKEMSDDDPLELFLQKSHRKSSNGEEWLSLGIGGLKNQLELLYRRVFLSRISSLQDVVGSVQLPHVRGVMLHGPPGNGKTLIARAIAKLLGKNTKVTIVNAADILSKYVGDSEKNLRDLILGDDDDDEDDDGSNDYNDGGYSYGDDNDNGVNDDNVNENRDDFNTEVQEDNDIGNEKKEGRLHTIIIDEIESLFRRRGESGDGSSAKAVYDGLTNQLLTLMDGVDRVPNILIVGLTNQLHSIDRALLRPGRFEVVIEIPLPDLEGRTEMLFIHTQKLREEQHLAPDVNLDNLAARTGGFSGADIAGTVRAAVSYALMRYRDMMEDDTSVGNNNLGKEGDLRTETSPKQFQVTSDDFNLAIRDMLDSMQQILLGKQYNGADKDDSTTPLIDFDGSITQGINTTRRVLQSIQRSQAEHAAVVIVYGPSGTGKTFLSQQLVKLLPFDIVKFIVSGKLYGSMRGDNIIDEVIIGLREAVNSKGNYSLVIENVERILNEGGSTTWDVLKTTIRDFKESAYTPSLLYEGETKKLHGKRLLIVTTSEKETLHSLMHSIEYDVQLTLHFIQRKDLLELLQNYGILPLNAEMANEVVNSYPPMLSYRQFLRITDLALWRAHDAEVKVKTALDASDHHHHHHQTTSVYSSLNAFFHKGGKLQKGASKNAVPSLDTKERQKQFSMAVRDVVTLMGLSDVFDDLPTENDVVEGDEVYW